LFIILLLLLYNNKHNKVLLCLTDTSLYVYICVKQFGMAEIKKYQVKSHLPYAGIIRSSPYSPL